MTVSNPAYWIGRLRQTLAGYDEELLRQVAALLVKPRSHWPVEELIDRVAATAANPAALDRRLQSLPAGSRRVLACIGHSRQPCWRLGNLVELAFALGQEDGLRPVLELLQAGLLYPELGPEGRVKKLEQWLAYPPSSGLTVFTTPLIASRAIGEDLELPDLSLEQAGEQGQRAGEQGQIAGEQGQIAGEQGRGGAGEQGRGGAGEQGRGGAGESASDGRRFQAMRRAQTRNAETIPGPLPCSPSPLLPCSSSLLPCSSSLLPCSSSLLPSSSTAGLHTGQEADGLEWLLRLAVLWQQVSAAPLRRTQQGGFFKRDADRLAQDPLLNAAPHDCLAEVPDAGFLVEALAQQEGLFQQSEGEVRVGDLPAAWDRGLAAALEGLWLALPHVQSWNPRDGWRGGDDAGANPFPSAYLLACLLLARLPDDAWVRPAVIETWITAHHPYWAGASMRPSLHKPWAEAFLLGVAYHLRLVQALHDPAAGWRVRLAPTGRWLLGLSEVPVLEPAYAQTLLVQPNLEIVAYRQGLTTGLLARLTRFAQWKSLGAACTLQLGPESIYRALESGQTYESIRLALEQHSTRAMPAAVLDSLRTWANKRERITVYPAATLLEFADAEDLNEALARGLPGVRIAGTLAVVASEEAIDYRHFRLTGTRDYALPPEKCVRVEPDGVTLTVDLGRSDLLLETELPRFAEPQTSPVANGRRTYRLTPDSLGAAREQGVNVTLLEAWFQQRTGAPLSPAARLLLTGAQIPAPRLCRHLVLHLASPELADGLMQWPQTRALIAERLGPTAVVVEEEHLEALRQTLRGAGIGVAESEPPSGSATVNSLGG